MASVAKHSKGYRAQVYVKGIRKSAVFRTKREAEAWAFETEESLRNSSVVESKTLRESLERYRDEVSPTKRGARWEFVRIEAFLADKHLPLSKRLPEVTPEDLGVWRDARLKAVSAGTVLRDFGLLSAVLEAARREWRWIQVNPIKDVRKPRSPDHREVLISPSQTIRMLRVMSYKRGRCASVTQAVCVAFLLALRTGMRAGEICALKWSDVFDGYVRVSAESIGAGKTSSARRDVPIVYKAAKLIQSMEGWDSVFVFGITSQSLDSMFRKYRKRAGLEGFTFHDSRHTAATMLARKLDVLTLCKVFGWKSTTMALTYYNPKADDIRQQLEPHRSR